MFFKKKKKRKRNKRKPPPKFKPRKYPRFIIFLDENEPCMYPADFDKPRPKEVVLISNGESDNDVLQHVLERAAGSSNYFVIITGDKGFSIDSGWLSLLSNNKKPSNVSLLSLADYSRIIQQVLHGTGKKRINQTCCNTKKNAIKAVFHEFLKNNFNI